MAANFSNPMVIARLQPVLGIQFGLEAALPMQTWRTKALHEVRVGNYATTKGNMKTLIALLCLSAQSLTAALIDTTPGGFDWSTATQIPPSLATIIHKQGQGQLAFFDDAAVVQPDGGHSTNIPGWVSAFGVLNGGTLFDTDLMDLDPTPTANVWWDFGDTGFSLRWIDAFGRDANGTPWEHWYYVNGISFTNAGSAQVTLNGSARIQDIALYGRTPFMPVPESGRSWALMALGIVATLLYKRLQNNSQPQGSTITQSALAETRRPGRFRG